MVVYGSSMFPRERVSVDGRPGAGVPALTDTVVNEVVNVGMQRAGEVANGRHGAARARRQEGPP